MTDIDHRKCRVYWASHGCCRPRDHDGPHLCMPSYPYIDEDGLLVDDHHDMVCSYLQSWMPTYGEDAFPGVDPRAVPANPPERWDWNDHRPGCWN